MPDRTQGDRPLMRAIRRGTRDLWAAVHGLVEWTTISSMSAGAGKVPTAETDDDDDVQVLEQYGVASRPPGTATALAFAPGGETQGRVAIGVSSVAGRPVTDAGDTSVWSAAGHQIVLDDDGELTITAKDGSSVVFAVSGAITINAGTGASITVNVDNGGPDVKIGDVGAVTLLKALASQTHIAGAATFATLPGNFIAMDGGVKAMSSFAAYILGVPPAVPGQSLVQNAATSKAKGT